jgi:ubiquinone/menaquinone biosynthesis C-methylase UbiE
LPAPMSTTSPDAAHATWAAHYATADGFRYMPSEELVRFCGRRRGALGRTLEVGCGNGANLWYLARETHTVVGVDFCTIALQAAQGLCDAEGEQRAWAPTQLVSATASALPFADNSFDTLVDCMVSQHVSWWDHETLYREYARVLAPGGTAFVYHLMQGTSGSTRNEFDYPDGIALFPAAGRMCLPDLWALELTLRVSGFDAIERRGMARTYPDGSIACYAVLEGTTT